MTKQLNYIENHELMVLTEANYREIIKSYSISDWKPLLDLIPEITATNKFGRIDEKLDFAKTGVIHLSPYILSELVTKFLDIVYKIPIIIDFDWGSWDEGRQIATDEEFDFDTIDIPTKCKLITAFVRNDRFCDGVLIEVFESGVILKILKSIKSQLIGDQYLNDDRTDPTGFLRRARLHQSKFRAEILNLTFESYGNYLTKEDGESGFNFYNGFGIFEAVRKRYRKYNKPLYSNMLRSEHIPFNLFIPFRQNLEYCKSVFNEYFNNSIESIDKIEIEFAPKPKEKYLKDATSFDAYIEFTRIDNTKGVIGIEVKYTEKEYMIVEGSTQWEAIRDPTSKYFSVSELSKLYKPDAIKDLPKDKFRQIWRNHLLGESILLADSDKFKHFTSLTLFPKGNIHFINTSKDYAKMLVCNEYKFLPVTYEDFFSACIKHCPDKKYRDWLDYLSTRYIIKDE